MFRPLLLAAHNAMGTLFLICIYLICMSVGVLMALTAVTILRILIDAIKITRLHVECCRGVLLFLLTLTCTANSNLYSGFCNHHDCRSMSSVGVTNVTWPMDLNLGPVGSTSQRTFEILTERCIMA